MSRWLPSEPCKPQARAMKRLGFTAQETDDMLVAVWSQGFMTLDFPAAWAPQDDAELVRRLMTKAYEQGQQSARKAMRDALGS